MPLEHDLISRREAIRRVSALLGGAALIGGSGLLAACEKPGVPVNAAFTPFTAEEIAFLDEIAETILPETKTPGAKAARTGAFMALMVTDSYGAADQRIFRDGLLALDDASKKAHNTSFMTATAEQRLAVLTPLDLEQKRYMDAREAADRRKKGLPPAPAEAALPTAGGAVPDERTGTPPGPEQGGATAVAADAPAHYFRMMKELTLLGYFTSEIGYTRAMRYEESPGRFEPCIPYVTGEPSWAQHA